jgi:hypothetical protein
MAKCFFIAFLENKGEDSIGKSFSRLYRRAAAANGESPYRKKGGADPGDKKTSGRIQICRGSGLSKCPRRVCRSHFPSLIN